MYETALLMVCLSF